jgi:hypothetical protein
VSVEDLGKVWRRGFKRKKEQQIGVAPETTKET